MADQSRKTGPALRNTALGGATYCAGKKSGERGFWNVEDVGRDRRQVDANRDRAAAGKRFDLGHCIRGHGIARNALYRAGALGTSGVASAAGGAIAAPIARRDKRQTHGPELRADEEREKEDAEHSCHDHQGYCIGTLWTTM